MQGPAAVHEGVHLTRDEKKQLRSLLVANISKALKVEQVCHIIAVWSPVCKGLPFLPCFGQASFHTSDNINSIVHVVIQIHLS